MKEQEWEGQRDAPPEGIGFNNLRRSQRVWNTSTPAQFKVTA